ncbi:hypothetical protein YC2023_051264 [Brassica napus]
MSDRELAHLTHDRDDLSSTLGVRLFSQRGYHSPVLEFLVLWSYSIDGLSLHSLQVDIIIRGSCLVQIRNRQKIPSWPGDFKRWMRVIHEELETWCIIIGLYFWWFMSYKRGAIATHLVYSKSFPS